MKKTYQGMQDKSKAKFEVLGKRELLEVPLPMVEVWEELQAQVEQLTGAAGLRIIGTILENEVTRRVGPPHRPESHVGRGALGTPAGLRDVWRPESGGGASAGAHARRHGSGTGQLRAAAARRKTTARGTRRHRRGADFAELSPGGAKRGGRLRD